MSVDKEAAIHQCGHKTAGVRKTFALFILPGQPNQALNQGTGWRRGAGDEEEREGEEEGVAEWLCLSWISY